MFGGVSLATPGHQKCIKAVMLVRVAEGGVAGGGFGGGVEQFENNLETIWGQFNGNRAPNGDKLGTN